MSKVFLFIITKNENDTKLNIDIGRLNNYWNGLGTCKTILSKKINYNKTNYIQNVYQIDYKYNKRLVKVDNSTGKEYFPLKIKYINDQKYAKNIYIKSKTYFFLYDFEVSDQKLSKCEQFNVFKEVINSKDSKDLLIDSMDYLIGKDDKFSLELFLDLLDFYYKKKEGELLATYIEEKWDYIYRCGKLNSKYNNILTKLEKNFELEFLDQTNNKNMEILCNLIFIYKTKNEKEKIQEMIYQKESYWHFYSKIIVRKLEFYSNLGVEFPQGLINIMLNQNNLTPEHILKLLKYGNSVLEILIMIINNFNVIGESCKQNKSIIKMHDLQKAEFRDDIAKLINKLKELIKKESECNYFFVSFDENFWLYYINYYQKDIEDIENLKIIENAILSSSHDFCSNLNKNMLINKIQENEIKIIKKQGLKNEEILNLFEEYYIKRNNNNSNIQFPSYFYEEINLETASKQFFIKWKKMNMISRIDNDIDNFIKKMLDTIIKIEDFGKIFNLFENNESRTYEIIINEYLKKHLDWLRILIQKFIELMKTFNINKSDKFIYDSCLLIYLIELSNNKDSVNFLSNVIFKYINYDYIKIKIIYNLLCKPYISPKLISFIIHYYFQSKNISNNYIEKAIIQKLNSNQCNHNKEVIEQILEDLNILIINKEELFNEEKNIKFFKLLQIIQRLDQNFDLSRYKNFIIFKNKITNLKDIIIKDLKIGNIKYDLIRSWLIDNGKRKLLRERLDVLSFYNKKEINDCIKSLENDLNRVNEAVKDAEKLKEVLKEYFPIMQQQNIEYINNFEKELKDKLLKEAKNKFNKSNHINDLILNDIDKLKSSKIFIRILNKKRGENLNNDEMSLFKCAQKNYIKLGELLDINWENSIIEIIEEFPFKELLNENENAIEEELFILKNYFEMNNINESEINIRKNRMILIINKKEEIISNLNNSFNFISEFATQNIGNSLNNLKDIIIKNINLELIDKYNNNNLIEKYFNNSNEQLISKLNNEKEKINNLNDQIQILKLELSNYKHENNNPEEKTISIIFQTADQSITRSYACQKTDIFVDLEKKLYNEYSKFKDLETYSMCNGRKIFRFKTLEENKIKDSDIIIINTFD